MLIRREKRRLALLKATLLFMAGAVLLMPKLELELSIRSGPSAGTCAGNRDVQPITCAPAGRADLLG